MKRRSFLAATSTLLLPTWKIVPEWFSAEKQFPFELLIQFCDTEGYPRYDMEHPFIQRGMASATNGHVGIRVKDCSALIDESTERKLPPLDGLFHTDYRGVNWRRWPDADYVPFRDGASECWYCDGYGMVGFDWCDRCGGDGMVEPCDDEHNWIVCPDCKDGKVGGVMCPECDGAGCGYDVISSQWIGNRRINPKYHRLISQLPDPEYAVDSGEVISIRFAGGQVLLMPFATPHINPN